MKHSFGSLHKLFGLILVVTGVGTSAQIGGPGGPGGVSATITKLFGDNQAFTAKAEVQLIDNSQKEIAVMSMDFSLLDKARAATGASRTLLGRFSRS